MEEGSESMSDLMDTKPIPEIDAQLYDKYGIADYKDFIESMIKSME